MPRQSGELPAVRTPKGVIGVAGKNTAWVMTSLMLSCDGYLITTYGEFRLPVAASVAGRIVKVKSSCFGEDAIKSSDIFSLYRLFCEATFSGPGNALISVFSPSFFRAFDVCSESANFLKPCFTPSAQPAIPLNTERPVNITKGPAIAPPNATPARIGNVKGIIAATVSGAAIAPKTIEGPKNKPVSVFAKNTRLPRVSFTSSIASRMGRKKPLIAPRTGSTTGAR